MAPVALAQGGGGDSGSVSGAGAGARDSDAQDGGMAQPPYMPPPSPARVRRWRRPPPSGAGPPPTPPPPPLLLLLLLLLLCLGVRGAEGAGTGGSAPPDGSAPTPGGAQRRQLRDRDPQPLVSWYRDRRVDYAAPCGSVPPAGPGGRLPLQLLEQPDGALWAVGSFLSCRADQAAPDLACGGAAAVSGDVRVSVDGGLSWRCRGEHPQIARLHAATWRVTRRPAAAAAAGAAATASSPAEAAAAPLCSAVCTAGGRHPWDTDDRLGVARQVYCASLNSAGAGGDVVWTRAADVPAPRWGMAYVHTPGADQHILLGGQRPPPGGGGPPVCTDTPAACEAATKDPYAGDLFVAEFDAAAATAAACAPARWAARAAALPVVNPPRMYPLAAWLDALGLLFVGGGLPYHPALDNSSAPLPPPQSNASQVRATVYVSAPAATTPDEQRSLGGLATRWASVELWSSEWWAAATTLQLAPYAPWVIGDAAALENVTESDDGFAELLFASRGRLFITARVPFRAISNRGSSWVPYSVLTAVPRHALYGAGDGPVSGARDNKTAGPANAMYGVTAGAASALGFTSILAVEGATGMLWRASLTPCTIRCGGATFVVPCKRAPTDALCQPCRGCAAGQFETFACLPYADTSCRSCTVCPAPFVEQQPCTTTQDSVCVQVGDEAEEDDDASIPDGGDGGQGRSAHAWLGTHWAGEVVVPVLLAAAVAASFGVAWVRGLWGPPAAAAACAVGGASGHAAPRDASLAALACSVLLCAAMHVTLAASCVMREQTRTVGKALLLMPTALVALNSCMLLKHGVLRAEGQRPLVGALAAGFIALCCWHPALLARALAREGHPGVLSPSQHRQLLRVARVLSGTSGVALHVCLLALTIAAWAMSAWAGLAAPALHVLPAMCVCLAAALAVDGAGAACFTSWLVAPSREQRRAQLNSGSGSGGLKGGEEWKNPHAAARRHAAMMGHIERSGSGGGGSHHLSAATLAPGQAAPARASTLRDPTHGGAVVSGGAITSDPADEQPQPGASMGSVAVSVGAEAAAAVPHVTPVLVVTLARNPRTLPLAAPAGAVRPATSTTLECGRPAAASSGRVVHGVSPNPSVSAAVDAAAGATAAAPPATLPGHAASASDSEGELSEHQLLRRLQVMRAASATADGRRLSRNTAFFRERPYLLGAATAAVALPTLPDAWGLVVQLLREEAAASSSSSPSPEEDAGHFTSSLESPPCAD